MKKVRLADGPECIRPLPDKEVAKMVRDSNKKLLKPKAARSKSK